jgi:hypothetical protein
VYETTVERVHFAKGLGVAEITPDSLRRSCKRRVPENYAKVEEYLETHPESVFLDFEEILFAVERIARYDLLIETAKQGRFSSDEQKGFVTCILVIHAMRSYEMMTSMIDHVEEAGMQKWEYLLMLRRAWATSEILARPAVVLAAAQWTLHRSNQHCLPLCDSPIMIKRDSIMAAISPRLLLEVDLTKPYTEKPCELIDTIGPEKYEEFRKRSIANTFREVIFHNPEELERWRATPECIDRVRVLRDQTLKRAVVAEAANRVIWALQGFGSRSTTVQK